MMEVLRVTPNPPNCAERARYNVGWLLFVAGALATFRLSHLVSKERGPLSVFERIRNALPRGRDSAQEWPRALSFACFFGPVGYVSRRRNGSFIGSVSVQSR
jgi:hypothetical protein